MNIKLFRVALATMILGAASVSFWSGVAHAQDDEQSTDQVVYCEVTEEDGSTSVWEVDSQEACDAMGGTVVSGN
ncbi:MAG: hypothetical protein KDH09_19985 [Chrysiogenetes bacterium]|nr:hypothetical protein [Chrysiogenetes bacterium]